MRKPRRERSAAFTVETAFVFPVLVFFILAIIIGAAGIFRYQEACHVAHEAARYASVHGSDYQLEQKKTAATAQDIYDNAIKPRLMTSTRRSCPTASPGKTATSRTTSPATPKSRSPTR